MTAHGLSRVAAPASRAFAGAATRQRYHGTVTGFKHRRGYGFVLLEGLVDPPVAAGAQAEGHAAVEAKQTHFFVRGALGGGFYITEGERVSFSIVPMSKQRETYRRFSDADVGESNGSETAESTGMTHSRHSEESADASDAAEALEKGRLLRAERLRLFNVETREEKPITPVMLYGKVVAWDAVLGVGTIAELDMHHELNEDAPRFAVSLEDADLAPGSELRVGRYTRFCLGPASGDTEEAVGGEVSDDHLSRGYAPLVARRVIIDQGMERRKAAFGQPLVPAVSSPGQFTEQTRFSGTIREMRGDKFGFIIDDLSGESIFFYGTNAKAGLGEGDRVSYLLREMTVGKHKGKKACFAVVPEVEGIAALRQGGPASSSFQHSHAGRSPRNDKTDDDDDDFDFDLLS